MSSILMRCPYGHDSTFQHQEVEEQSHIRNFDMHCFERKETFKCNTCKRSFTFSILRCVCYFDDQPVDQFVQRSEVSEVRGPWSGSELVFLEAEAK